MALAELIIFTGNKHKKQFGILDFKFQIANLEPIFFDFAVEGSFGATETGSSFFAVATTGFEGLADELFLAVIDA